MAYLYTFPNGTTPDTIVSGVITTVPVFSTGLLVFVFLVTLLGGIGRQKAKGWQADYPMWGTIAGIATFLLALVMGVQQGFISLPVTIVVLAVTLGFGLWLFIDRRSNEV